MGPYIPRPIATRALSRQVLARDLAALITDAACAELTTQWSAWEKVYEQANTAAERTEALTEPLGFCANCPATHACADLAQLSRYSGIAASCAYSNGYRLDNRGQRIPYQP